MIPAGVTAMPLLRLARRLCQDASPSAALSGLMAVIIGFAGPTVLVYAVAASAHLPGSTVLSWVWGATVITGVLSVVLSVRTRLPLMSTWSTPGIAFLVTALPGVPFTQAVGAFLLSGVLVLLLGYVPPLARWLGRLPTPLAAALNAAILLPFAFRLVRAAAHQPLLVGAMTAAYFVLRQVAPRWSVAGVLVTGVGLSAALGQLHPGAVPLALTVPQVFWPQFSLHAALALALPLTLLAFTGQFVPGFAVLQVAGYTPPTGAVLRACGVASVAAAFVGCHTLTPAALLANVVSGPEAHPAPGRRYMAAVYAGLFNIVLGLFAGTFLHVLGALPTEAVQALAGLALLGAISSSLQVAFQGRPGSLAAPVVLAVSLSGVAVFSIGAAFWGIVVGGLVWALEDRPRRAARADAAAVQDRPT